MEEKPSKTSKMSYKLSATKTQPDRPPCPQQCTSKKCKDYKAPPPVDLSRHVFIWLYGGPASGKSTVCSWLIEKYKFVPIHCGELLNDEVATGSVRAKMIQHVMHRGELVPNDVVLPLLKHAIQSRVGETTGFVIDGYPRDIEQGYLFEKNIAPVDLILYLDALKDSLTTRHMERAAETAKRWDDDAAEKKCAAEKLQLRRFFTNHKPILDKYLHKMHRVNCELRVAEVLAECEAAVYKAVSKHNADLKAKLDAIQKIKESQAVLRERLNKYKI